MPVPAVAGALGDRGRVLDEGLVDAFVHKLPSVRPVGPGRPRRAGHAAGASAVVRDAEVGPVRHPVVTLIEPGSARPEVLTRSDRPRGGGFTFSVRPVTPAAG